jgi:hypothetical protein
MLILISKNIVKLENVWLLGDVCIFWDGECGILQKKKTRMKWKYGAKTTAMGQFTDCDSAYLVGEMSGANNISSLFGSFVCDML